MENRLQGCQELRAEVSDWGKYDYKRVMQRSHFDDGTVVYLNVLYVNILIMVFHNSFVRRYHWRNLIKIIGIPFITFAYRYTIISKLKDPLEEGMEWVLQYSCLENPMDREATIKSHRVGYSWSMHTHTHTQSLIKNIYIKYILKTVIKLTVIPKLKFPDLFKLYRTWRELEDNIHLFCYIINTRIEGYYFMLVLFCILVIELCTKQLKSVMPGNYTEIGDINYKEVIKSTRWF